MAPLLGSNNILNLAFNISSYISEWNFTFFWIVLWWFSPHDVLSKIYYSWWCYFSSKHINTFLLPRNSNIITSEFLSPTFAIQPYLVIKHSSIITTLHHNKMSSNKLKFSRSLFLHYLQDGISSLRVRYSSSDSFMKLSHTGRTF